MPAFPRPYTLAERARRLLCDEMWAIGVVDQPIADIVRRGIAHPPRWLAVPGPRCMLADPACRVWPDGRRTLYAEYLDYRVGIGEIWKAEVPAGSDPAGARFARWLVPPCHASYPFPFEDHAHRPRLTAETWQAGEASIWEGTDPGEIAGKPAPPRRLGALASGPIVDPTLHRGRDRWWLFCGRQDASPDAALLLYHAP